MSIMVKKLYKNGTFLYNMKLIAGKNGLNNLVQWVHIIEDDSVISFLHGSELVFTAGILNAEDGWLLRFARKLAKAQASAFVVNIGPHTKKIPAEVAAFCDQAGLPLFTIPWETKMVDMTRDFCQRIMDNDHKENNLATTVKNIIFGTGDFNAQVIQLERYGYPQDSRFCFISTTVRELDGVRSEEYRETLDIIAEKTAKSMHELYLSFSYKDDRIFVLVNYTDPEIETFRREFLRYALREAQGGKLHIGISSNAAGIRHQKRNFEKAVSAMEMAAHLKTPCCHYDRLGIYKVLYAVEDREILRGYYTDTVGSLEVYDKQNGTRFTHLLKTYLENNGSLQLVSEKLYIHRNTVTNQLRKIQSITGLDPMELEDKVQLSVGFYIRDIL